MVEFDAAVTILALLVDSTFFCMFCDCTFEAIDAEFANVVDKNELNCRLGFEVKFNVRVLLLIDPLDAEVYYYYTW